MFNDSRIKEILDRYRVISSLDSVNSLLGWDLETYMPVDGIEGRSNVLAHISVLKQKMVLELGPMVQRIESENGLDAPETGVLRALRRELHFYTSLPDSFVEEYSRTTAQATVKWREARMKSDFKMFAPHLEKVLQLSREESDYLGYESHPYNALLDLYEEGMTVSVLDNIFSTLASELGRIRDRVMAERYFSGSHPLELVRYDPDIMKQVNMDILKLLDMPENRFRMDISTHPFTTKIGFDDVRITTRYEGVDFKKTIYSTIHESGHAIHALQQDPELRYTPIADTDSLGISESQSRFWENIIGRSRNFVTRLYPIIRSRLSFISAYTEEDIYRYVNSVKPSLIRVDADEVTYNFHIMLRYSLEKELISGKLNVNELPARWNELMAKLIGVVPEHDKDGVLQDTHWSGGGFGYFPTYSLGNIIAGMIWFKLKDQLNSMNYLEIKKWLYLNIHKWGKIYPPATLQHRIFGESYNPDKLISYLDRKYIHF